MALYKHEGKSVIIRDNGKNPELVVSDAERCAVYVMTYTQLWRIVADSIAILDKPWQEKPIWTKPPLEYPRDN